ncbi:GTPase [candidate division WOR-3 bacterium JGI_Cruoil_03_44_89]|uniref:GTPase n=1 Tax=candidate division WOR-3 bacterium JGI_Cruoil_03_44_89 TaxID=1973748 RepID=A0A235C080_UNCW3|nr:MAG: GTPase [candidate division WOR-3 bacterium JGI_Cruoil_03_44_89]
MPKRVIIMGAAGRDFHNFNVFFRNNREYEVLGFTATQIPDIEGRRYPPVLAGSLYREGIPIYPQSELTHLIKDLSVDIVVFAYSDVSHNCVMHIASTVLSAGADFVLLGPKSTMIESQKPLVSVCAVRTGCGKSQTSRRVADILKKHNKRVCIIRHPMPYGDLEKQVVQRFASYDDLDREKCTIEEREEYEPIIDREMVVYAGVDYGEILKRAEKEADVILWDGGNNDFPFYKPDVSIVVVDPLRAGHEVLYHPGETNLRMANVIVVNKMDSAKDDDVKTVNKNIKNANPDATVIFANSSISITDPDIINGKRVLVVEDGPTLTHGGMAYGAGFVAAKRFGAKEIIDPRPYAVGSIRNAYKKYTTTGSVLPAMGYGEQQIRELEETITKTPCDSLVVATPIDITRIIKIRKPYTRVRYELEEIGKPDIEEVLLKTVLREDVR